eukprot:scaffold5989_cov70-Phaeocystis_antarctica.AAC.5
MALQSPASSACCSASSLASGTGTNVSVSRSALTFLRLAGFALKALTTSRAAPLGKLQVCVREADERAAPSVSRTARPTGRSSDELNDNSKSIELRERRTQLLALALQLRATG